MNLTDLFLAELEREAANTRRTLERVPEGRYEWKPHEKSMPMDGAVAKARAALSGTTDDHLMKLLAGGHVVSEQPRHLAIRDGVLSHWAHHRGQLTVYLRLNDAPVPSIYGPTADEPLPGAGAKS
jgi:hypothetical protein